MTGLYKSNAMGSNPFNSINNCIIICTLYYCPFMLPINLIMFYPRCLQLLKMKLEIKYWLENIQINKNIILHANLLAILMQ